MIWPEPYATPILAYKLARLVAVDGRAKLAPLHSRSTGPGFYENPGEAGCDEGHDHEAPHRNCTCGFYAVGSREELWRLGWGTLETASLEVLLHGRIVEHKYGYRSQRQDVVALELPGRCWWCGEGAEFVSRRRRGQRHLAPSCGRCSRYDKTTLEKLGEDLGCTVAFTEEFEDKASSRVERNILFVQTIPGALVAVLSGVLAVITKNGSVAGVGGLVAGGWLMPGRLLAERLAGKSGLGVKETYRVLARTGGAALLTAMCGWGVAGLLSVFYTGI